MAGDSVSVTYAALESASAGFNSSMAKLTSQIQDLNTRVKALLSSFEGQTAANFQINLGQVNSGFSEMEQVVGQLSKVLAEANTTYQGADKAASALFS